MKPISFERFLRAINKILLSKKDKTQIIEKTAKPSYFIFFKADKKIHKFYFRDILFIEGSGNYVKIHSENEQPLMVLDKLGELIKKLPETNFCRVHKSYIVNVHKIMQVEGNRIKFKNTHVPISSTYKQDFERYIRNEE